MTKLCRTKRATLRRYFGTTSMLTGVAIAGLLLASCGTSASSEANRACMLVHRSIKLYDASHITHGSRARSDLARAELLLSQAVAPANIAASTDSYWQSLAGTLAETGQLPESRLINSLRAQCAPSANNQGEYIKPFKPQG
ncbi:hypothetical protein [Ferrimicrobium acidiphilum]|uniref:hypothetical protein n=1 Tax=Ferrimicrobium acidiphilum TaxID=121039 RepID=UPI00126A1495|nr:hypothetical protein [Ferrimicrobium acidiphilum]